MARMEFKGEFLALREKMKSDNAEERENAAMDLIIKRDLFPKVGTLGRSRKKDDRVYAVPDDLLTILLERAYQREAYLRESVTLSMKLEEWEERENEIHTGSV